MRTVCVLVLSLVSVNQVACGGSQAQRALTAAAAYAAVELAATAIEAAGEEARARDAAKQATADRRRAATDNWRLVRNGDECASPMSEAEEEDCEARGDDEQEIETEEAGLNLGQCIVCK